MSSVSSAAGARFKGVFPVVPTTFTESGELDLPSQMRCVDFMIDAGSNGLCILANFSEQFVLSDAERETLTTQRAGPAGRCRHGDGDAAVPRGHDPRAGRQDV